MKYPECLWFLSIVLSQSFNSIEYPPKYCTTIAAQTFSELLIASVIELEQAFDILNNIFIQIKVKIDFELDF